MEARSNACENVTMGGGDLELRAEPIRRAGIYRRWMLVILRDADSSVLERRTRIQKVAASILGTTAGEFSSPELIFCANLLQYPFHFRKIT